MNRTRSGLPQFIMEPGRGVGPVSLGMTRGEVTDAVAEVGGGEANPSTATRACYFNSAFHVSFGASGRVEFIELSSRLDGELLFAGQDVFDLPADELVQLLSQHDRFDPELSRPPGQYLFPNIIMTLWGPDTQYDHRGGYERPVYAAVGLGGLEYLTAIRQIRRSRHPG